MVTPDSTSAQVPLPTPDESFERYSIRAHQALADSGMDVHERSQLVRYTWHQHRGLTEEEEIAKRTFDPSKYRYVPDVVIFAEHETIDKQGRPRKYGLKELAQIVKDCNARVVNRGVFAAISDGHTSNPGDAVKRDPAILGWSGPVRLGIVDRHKPTWGILADEFHIKEACKTLDSKPRRSVELWTFRNGAEMHFDPVAAIGAEAPRLPLPMRYSFGAVAADDDGVQPELDRYSVAAIEGGEVEKYTFCAAEHYDATGGGAAGGFAFPGGGAGSNTHVRSFGCGKSKPTKYAETPAFRAPQPGKPGIAMMPAVGTPAHQAMKDSAAATARFNADRKTQLDAQVRGLWGDAPLSAGKAKYAETPTVSGASPMGSDVTELAREVVSFLAQTPEFQWVREQMMQAGGAALPGNSTIDDLAAAPPGAPGAEDATPSAPGPSGLPGEAPQGGPPNDMGQTAPAKEDDLSDIIDQVGDKGAAPQPHAEPDGDEGAKPFPKPEEKNSMSYTQSQGGQVEKYAALQASHDQLMGEHTRTLARLEALEKSHGELQKSRSDAHRRMKIRELADKYTSINADEEAQRWLYSANASAGNDGEFDAFCAVVEKYAAPKVGNVNLPEGEVAPNEQPPGEVEKFQSALRPELLRVHQEFVTTGKPVDYAAERQEAITRLAARGITQPK